MERKNERSPNRNAYSLLDLTQNIQSHIERTYASSYWIKAEINRLNYYPQSGHCYPELVEKKDGRIVAEIRGMIFRNSYEEIERNFQKTTGRSLTDGIEVLMRCKVRYDPKYGLSLLVSDIDPSYTLGEMARQRTEAINRLKKAGVFELNGQLYLPKLIRRLAVISVETSKGWRDFTEIIEESPFAGLIDRILFPAKLQGDMAVSSISAALKKISSYKEPFDAVAIIRGGGGESGMDCYDNYELAHMVASFPIPVLTGIGHSTNLTVVEMCGNQNLITPTALASFILGGFEDFSLRLESATSSLKRINKHVLPLIQNRLDGKTDMLDRVVSERLKQEINHLSTMGHGLDQLVRSLLKERNRKLDDRLPMLLETSAKQMLRRNLTELTSKAEILPSKSLQSLANQKVALDHLEEKRRLLDPTNVLKRGYSITMKNGKAVTSAEALHKGEEITTILAKGEIRSTVNPKENGK